MRTLIWTESFWPHVGGSEVAVMSLIDQMRSRGHEFTVVTRQLGSDEPATDDYQGVPIHRVAFDDDTLDRLEMSEIIPMRRRVVEIKKQFQPDLVHVGLTGPSLFLHLFTASQWPVPTLLTMHVALVPGQFGRKRPTFEALKQADWVVMVSRSLREQTCAKMPEVRARSKVVYNGLAQPNLEPTPLVLDPPRLLLAGRLVEQKGVETAIAAMPQIRRRFADARLTVAGDGPLRQDLENQVAAAGLGNAVRFLGWVPPEKMHALINQHGLVLVPSRWEPFGLVALQAGQMERPTVASNVDGLPEVLRDGQTGRLVEPDDVTALADAVSSLLAEPAAAIAMGRRARHFVANEFSVRKNTDAYEDLYHRVAANKATQKQGLTFVKAG